MNQLPGFTQWPVFREILFVFSEVLNFIFNQWNNIGVVNIILSIIFFSLFYQLLLLPFSIHRSIDASANAKKKIELKRIEREYKDKLSDPVSLSEYKKKCEEIQKGRKKKKKGMGCLVFFIQFFVMMNLLNILAYMNHYVRILSVMDDNALTKACSLFGLDMRIVAKEDWWPAILVIVLYVAVFFLPNAIRKRIIESKEKKEWLAELSSEECSMVECEEKKIDSFSVVMLAIKCISPALVFYLSMNVPLYFVVYWTFNVMWSKVLLYGTNFLYRKVWLQAKKKIAEEIKEKRRGMKKYECH